MTSSKKIESQVKIFTSIVSLIKQGFPPSHLNEKKQEEGSVCSSLGMSKQNLTYYLSSLKAWKVISNPKKFIWQVDKELTPKELENQVKTSSKKNSSRGMNIDKPIINLHALEIKFPILEGKIQDSEWEIKNHLKNWLPKYKGLTNLGGLELRNNNNKSLTVFAKSRDIEKLEEIDNLAFKIRTFIFEYFKKKHNVILDVLNCETKNINIATEDKPSQGMLRKGEKFELAFDKETEKIFPNDHMQSKAWIDGSPFKFTAETNDKEWKRNYLKMPFMVAGLANSMPAIQEYSRNILLHMEVQKAQLENQKVQTEVAKKQLEVLNKMAEKLR